MGESTKHCAYVKKKTTPRKHIAYYRSKKGTVCKKQTKKQAAKSNRPKRKYVRKYTTGKPAGFFPNQEPLD